MESDITFLVSYRCPRCHAALSAGPAGWSSWLRCPKCGRPSLPPDDPRPRPGPEPLTGVLVIGPGDSPAARGARRPPARVGSVRRLVLVTGLFLALLMLLFSLLDQNSINASVFGFAALVFIGFLLLPSKR